MVKRKPTRRKAEQKFVITEKRPRQYAAEIMAAPKEQRAEKFAAVPDHLKDMVKDHCETIQRFNKSKSYRFN